MKRVYLDHNATTPVRPEVLEAALPYLGGGPDGRFGNPSSPHLEGSQAREAIEEARERVAALLHAEPAEIVFTSGGTESDGLAIRGALEARGGRSHLVTTAVEHPAVLEAAARARGAGTRVTILPVDSHGLVDPAGVEAALTPDTALVSVMAANNETGTLLPVAEIAAICRSRGVPFHTDAVQAAGKVTIDLAKLPADLLSISGHKLNAFKGTGALYVRRGTRLARQIDGGPQERRRRAGTENVAGIVALGAAADLAGRDLAPRAEALAAMRDFLWEGIAREVPGARLNGHPERRLPNTLNVRFDGVPAESLLVALDLEGIAVSAGSACSTGSLEPSRVLLAMGLDEGAARASVRFSLGHGTERADIARVLEVLPSAVRRAREARAVHTAA
jgi:cysteine desulfurase